MHGKLRIVLHRRKRICYLNVTVEASPVKRGVLLNIRCIHILLPWRIKQEKQLHKNRDNDVKPVVTDGEYLESVN